MNIRLCERVNADAPTYTFTSMDEIQPWEIWHQCYGHVAYGGLQKLVDNNMVLGLTVDTQSLKPDCMACTEAKMYQEPYGAATHRDTNPGDLTHMDLWGKYKVTSISRHQYYILFVDDAARYVTVNFLKRKTEAPDKVKEYLAYLSKQNKSPKALHVDRGTEFINENLQIWC